MLNDVQKNEMRTQYRDAADKKKQIGILADLYACSRADVLSELGIKTQDDATQKQQPYQQAKKNGSAKKSYSQAVKKDVVKAVLLEGLTQAAVAERYGIPFQTVGHWVTMARKTQKQFMDAADEILADMPEQTVPAVEPQVQWQRIGAACAPLYNADGKRVPAVDNPAWTQAVDEMVREHPAKQAREQMVVEPDFEAAAQQMDREISMQLRLNDIDSAVSGLRTACHSLADAGMLEEPERDVLEQIVVRAAAFRAGMLYAMTREKMR